MQEKWWLMKSITKFWKLQNLGNGIYNTIFPTLMYVWNCSFIKWPNKTKIHVPSTITSFQIWVCLRIHISCRILRFIPQNSDFVYLGMGPDSIFTQSSIESDTIYRIQSTDSYLKIIFILLYHKSLNISQTSKEKHYHISYLPLLRPYLLISYPFPETINSMKAKPMFVFIHHGVPSAYQSACKIKFCWMNKWINNSKEYIQN